MQLRAYQEMGIYEVARLFAAGKRRVIRQLMTGGGKTVEFANVCKRALAKGNGPILILVHREELMRQARRTIFDWCGKDAQMIEADTKGVYNREIYIGMVETVFRRLSKNANYLPQPKIVIIDEAHRGEFKKLYQFFPAAYLLAYTATPLSSKKSDPLKNYFDEIITGPNPRELIALGSLVQNRTYSAKGVNRGGFHLKGGEFDAGETGTEMSKTKHVENTLHWYRKVGRGKAIIYNCNIEHSMKVLECFSAAGYQCRHVDGATPKDERAAIFHWFANTPGAILCNVDVATTGTDIPSVETIIFNRLTTSVVVWLQATGRGSRPYPGKSEFTIIDMGGNALELGDWCDDRDWRDIFHNPAKPRQKKGAPPVKLCPKCESIIPVQSMTCKYCGFQFPRKKQYDATGVNLVLVTKNVNVQELAKKAEQRGYKEYYALFDIGRQIARAAKFKGEVTEESFNLLLQLYREKGKEWAQLKNVKWTGWHENITKNYLNSQIYGVNTALSTHNAD